MEKKLPPLDSRWDNSIPNQTNPPTPNFDRNGAMGPNKMETIVEIIPMEPNGLTEGILNQKNPVTPNVDRNGAMGPNELGTIVPQIPMEPNGLTEERKSPPLYSQREMETKKVEIQRLEKVVRSQGLQALGEKEMEKAKIASGYQNQVRFLTSDLKTAQMEAQYYKSMLKKSEENVSKVSYFQNIFRHP
jgi:hypothetical protein